MKKAQLLNISPVKHFPRARTQIFFPNILKPIDKNGISFVNYR